MRCYDRKLWHRCNCISRQDLGSDTCFFSLSFGIQKIGYLILHDSWNTLLFPWTVSPLKGIGYHKNEISITIYSSSCSIDVYNFLSWDEDEQRFYRNLSLRVPITQVHCTMHYKVHYKALLMHYNYFYVLLMKALSKVLQKIMIF